MNMAKKLVNYETVSYIVIGVLTTIVDYAAFWLINEGLQNEISVPKNAAVMAATVFAWLLAVIFAYVTNKLIVFHNYSFAPAHLAKEISGFFAARFASGLITFFLMWLMADKLGWNEYLAKILISVLSLVMNYLASKLWIFKKETKRGNETH